MKIIGYFLILNLIRKQNTGKKNSKAHNKIKTRPNQLLMFGILMLHIIVESIQWH